MFQEASRLTGASSSGITQSDADSPRPQQQVRPQAEGQDANAGTGKQNQGISFMGTFLPSLPSSSQSPSVSDSLSSSRSGISQYMTEVRKQLHATDITGDNKMESASRRVSFADEAPSAARQEHISFMGVLLPTQASSNSESSVLTGPSSHSSCTPKKPVHIADDHVPWFCPGSNSQSLIEGDSERKQSRGKMALSPKYFERLAISKDQRRTPPQTSTLKDAFHMPSMSVYILGSSNQSTQGSDTLHNVPGRASLRSSSRSKKGIESTAAASEPGAPSSGQTLPEMPEELIRLIPLDENKRQTSVGSIQHASGQCLPCAYWFKGICKFGIQCLHCHFIHDGQKSKRLRPSKQTRIRLRRRAAAANQAGLDQPSDNENDHGEQEGDSSLANITKLSL